MSGRNQILVTSAPKSSRWGVPTVASGLLVLIGWRLAAGRPIDGGVPPVVAALLARGFTRSFRVSYFDAAEPPKSTAACVTRLAVSGVGARLRALAQHLPATVFQISTRDPETAKAAFNASLFSWTMQGQALLLSDPEAPSRALGWGEMWSVTERTDPITSDALTALNAQALVLPGVDGDVAALVSSTVEIEAKMLAALRMEAELGDFDWRLLNEEDFALGV